jgi:hypothetical protein
MDVRVTLGLSARRVVESLGEGPALVAKCRM